MGKLSRLNARKVCDGQKRRTEWFAGIYNDFSYEVKNPCDGVVTKVENIVIMPLGTPSGFTTSFPSYVDVETWVKDMTNKIEEPVAKARLSTLDVRAFEVKYVPSKVKIKNADWLKTNVINSISLDMKSFVSSVIK